MNTQLQSPPSDAARETPAAAGPHSAGGPDARILLGNLLAAVPDHIYFKDLDSRFVAVSASLAKREGLLPEDLLGSTDFERFAEAHARPAFEDEQQIIRTGEPVVNKLEKEHWTDGHVTYVLTSKMPLRDEAGRITGTFGISKDVTAAKLTEAALEKTRNELIAASRAAGMAEVATGVLHNVGNVLVSINVATDSIASAVRHSKVDSLEKIAALFKEHEGDIARYIAEDPKGRLIPGFIAQLATHLASDREKMLAELESLRGHVAHVKDIVTMQQNYARLTGAIEPLDPVSLVEDALRMNSGALVRHEVAVVRDFQSAPPVLAERGKVLQILVNLIRNAKYACDEGNAGRKEIVLRIAPCAPGRVRFEVADTGVGIAAENLTRIFVHGFTTKPDGHGFGLHSSANAAGSMGGSLAVRSDGIGKGATFTLELPVAPATKSESGAAA